MPRSKRPSARWDDLSTYEYLCLLVEHSEKQLGKLPKSPTLNKWIGILKAKCGEDFLIGSLKSKYHRMRADYQGICFLRNHTGLGWDEEKQVVVATDEQWSDFTQVHPTLNSLRDGLPNLDLYEIGGGGASDDDLDSQEDLTMDTGPRSGEKRSRTVAPAQNKRNKGKVKISYEDSISAMATAFVAKQERAVSSMESRQTGLQSEELFEQITEIGCVGAIDGTHIPCVVDADVAAAYRWEGSCHDARVLNVTTSNPAFMFPHAPEGKYYLVDASYKNKPGFLTPFRGQNYHLHDRRREDGDRRKEMFNYRHASLRNVIERTFGVWKNRFCILRGIPRYPLEKQRDIVIACAVLHNFIKLFSSEDTAFNPEDDVVDDGNAEDDVGDASTQQQQREESNDMGYI
ncbi:hypothetical protein UlMin_031808 [Ulmus minor]